MRNPASATARSPLPQALAGQSVLIIGGSSGIGLAAARLLVDVGAQITLAARNPERLAAAALYLEGKAQTRQADATDTSSLKALFASIGQLDHVFVTAGTLAGGSLADTEVAALRPTLDSHI